jgi:ferredoxin
MNGYAVIDERACIRCGTCHDVCPHEAVRHDSERIPEDVAANVEWTQNLLRHFEVDVSLSPLTEALLEHSVQDFVDVLETETVMCPEGRQATGGPARHTSGLILL